MGSLQLTLELDGQEVRLSVPDHFLGIEVGLVRRELKPGVLHLFFDVKMAEDTLREGLRTDLVGTITCTPTCFLKAWRVLIGHDVDDSEQILEGITQMTFTPEDAT